MFSKISLWFDITFSVLEIMSLAFLPMIKKLKFALEKFCWFFIEIAFLMTFELNAPQRPLFEQIGIRRTFFISLVSDNWDTLEVEII